MADQQKNIVIELPSNLNQQEIWYLEEQLKQVEGLQVDLQEPKTILSTYLLILNLTISIMGPIITIGGGIKSIHDVAIIIFEFLHSKVDKDQVIEESKKKVTVTKKGKKIEIYNLSIEEIEKLLKDI